MINGILMKKLLVLSLVFACLTGEAANKADSVVMTVAGKQVSLDEFVFMARKKLIYLIVSHWKIMWNCIKTLS